MVRFKPSILFVVLTVLTGCSAQPERSKEQEPNRVEQKDEQRPSSVTTFRYRPSAGLTIKVDRH
jgi:outer membrane biogenesis lipoprotein LolB